VAIDFALRPNPADALMPRAQAVGQDKSHIHGFLAGAAVSAVIGAVLFLYLMTA
jgi:hypothetical protein